MTNFKQIRREQLIKEALKLLDRADLLVNKMIQNAKTASCQRTDKAA